MHVNRKLGREEGRKREGQPIRLVGRKVDREVGRKEGG